MPILNINISIDEKLELMELQTQAVKEGKKKPSFSELVRNGYFQKKKKSEGKN